jgi:hypothetical protein
VTIGELSSQSFMQRKPFMPSSDRCISHPKVSKGKRHEQPLTKSIRFKVILEVNVSRVTISLDPELEVSVFSMDVVDVKNYMKSQGSRILWSYEYPSNLCFA